MFPATGMFAITPLFDFLASPYWFNGVRWLCRPGCAIKRSWHDVLGNQWIIPPCDGQLDSINGSLFLLSPSAEASCARSSPPI